MSETDRAGPLVIGPPAGWVGLNWGELWEYRELLLFLTWRDIQVRYKQTVLGMAWAVLQPLLAMLAFSLFFGRLAKMPSDGVPYPIFAYCALVPWQLFAYALTESGSSLIANQNLISKVYFPRLVIPMSAVLAGLVDFLIAFAVLVAMMGYYGLSPSMAAWALPAAVALIIGVALGAGLWLSALNVRYRDVRYTIPFLVQFWLFVTPIAYPSSLVPAQWRSLYGLNPMVGVVEVFRWALLGTPMPAPGMLAMSLAATTVLLISGLYYFRRMEDTFADSV